MSPTFEASLCEELGLSYSIYEPYFGGLVKGRASALVGLLGKCLLAILLDFLGASPGRLKSLFLNLVCHLYSRSVLFSFMLIFLGRASKHG